MTCPIAFALLANAVEILRSVSKQALVLMTALELASPPQFNCSFFSAHLTENYNYFQLYVRIEWVLKTGCSARAFLLGISLSRLLQVVEEAITSALNWALESCWK